MNSLRNAIFALAIIALGPAHAKEPVASNGSKPNSSRLILAHYMPWFAAKPKSQAWGWHWSMNHFDPDQIMDGRRQIASKCYPLIGPYDSGDVDVVEYHLLLMKLAGIDGVIVDWYGLTEFNDYGFNHRNTLLLVEQVQRLGMKLVVCYEDQVLPALVAVIGRL